MTNNDMSYDDSNIFARILRGELPCDTVYEDAHVLAFNDINPQMPVHILLIPKAAFANLDVFCQKADDELCVAFWRAAGRIAQEQGLAKGGWRLIINCGQNGRQEVPHLHAHLLGGKDVGTMIAKD